MPVLAWYKFIVITVFRNLWRAPRRTFFVLITIAVAVCSLILFRSFMEGVKATFRYNIIHCGIGHYHIFKKGFLEHKAEDPFAYPIQGQEAVREAIQKEVGPLALFSQRQEFFALMNFRDRSIAARGVGVDAKNEQKYFSLYDVVKGQHLADSPEDSVFLGVGLANQLQVKPGDTITLVVNTATGSLNAWDVGVAGIFKTGINEVDEYIFHIHTSLAYKLLRIKGVSKLLIAFDTDNELPFQAPLQNLLAKKFPDLELVHWRHFMGEYFDNTINWLDNIFSIFRIIMLVVATLGIVNIFMINLFERMGEIATLRAIGTQRSEIRWIILLESVLQSILGALLGVGIAIFITSVLLRNGITMPPPPAMTGSYHVALKVDFIGIITSVALAVVVAGGSGILPAIRMARTNIVRALGANV